MQKMPVVSDEVLSDVMNYAVNNRDEFVAQTVKKLIIENPLLLNRLLLYIDVSSDKNLSAVAVFLSLIVYQSLEEQLEIDNELSF